MCSLQLSACKSHRNGCNKDVHWSHGLCNPVVSFSLFGIFFLSSGSPHIPLCCHHSFSASICLELPSSSSLLLDIISFYWQDHQLQRPLVKLGTFFLPSKSWIFELWTSLNLQPRFELFACILISYDTLQLHVLSGVSSCILRALGHDIIFESEKLQQAINIQSSLFTLHLTIAIYGMLWNAMEHCPLDDLRRKKTIFHVYVKFPDGIAFTHQQSEQPRSFLLP